MNQHPPPAAPEGRRDLSRQERGGRAGDEHLGAVGIQQPTDEAFPAGDDLNLVEVPDYRLSGIPVRDGAAVLGDEQAEVRGVEVRKPLVLEREVRQPLPGNPLLDALLAELVQERGLAGPAHAWRRTRPSADPHGLPAAGRRQKGRMKPPSRCARFRRTRLAARHTAMANTEPSTPSAPPERRSGPLSRDSRRLPT